MDGDGADFLLDLGDEFGDLGDGLSQFGDLIGKSGGLSLDLGGFQSSLESFLLVFSLLEFILLGLEFVLFGGLFGLELSEFLFFGLLGFIEFFFGFDNLLVSGEDGGLSLGDSGNGGGDLGFLLLLLDDGLVVINDVLLLLGLILHFSLGGGVVINESGLNHRFSRFGNVFLVSFFHLLLSSNDVLLQFGDLSANGGGSWVLLGELLLVSERSGELDDLRLGAVDGALELGDGFSGGGDLSGSLGDLGGHLFDGGLVGTDSLLGTSDGASARAVTLLATAAFSPSSPSSISTTCSSSLVRAAILSFSFLMMFIRAILFFLSAC
jgi:hypothetical protein